MRAVLKEAKAELWIGHEPTSAVCAGISDA